MGLTGILPFDPERFCDVSSSLGWLWGRRTFENRLQQTCGAAGRKFPEGHCKQEYGATRNLRRSVR
jgi:hypothetical protein